jgi:hypothetical protein
MTRNRPLGGAAAAGAKRVRSRVTIARPEVLDNSKAAPAQRIQAGANRQAWSLAPSPALQNLSWS